MEEGCLFFKEGNSVRARGYTCSVCGRRGRGPVFSRASKEEEEEDEGEDKEVRASSFKDGSIGSSSIQE